MTKYYWYSSTETPPADKVAGGLYGYEHPQEYETVERYDLRFVSYETFEELTERYF